MPLPAGMGLIILIISAHALMTWNRYRRLKPKLMTTFRQYEDNARRFETQKQYDLAIAIRNQALSLEKLSNQERAHLMLSIGGTYLYMNKQAEATKYFDTFFEAVDGTRFPYDRQYRKVVQAYKNCGRNSDAERILGELIARQCYDERFKRFEKLKT